MTRKFRRKNADFCQEYFVILCARKNGGKNTKELKLLRKKIQKKFNLLREKNAKEI